MPLLHAALHQLSLMRTAIGLLALSALASLMGTIVPQGLPIEDYIPVWGVWGAQVLWYSGLTDVFRAWWFLGVQAVLITSVSVCVLRNGPRIYQQIFVPRMLPPGADVRANAAGLREEGFRLRGVVAGHHVYSRGELNRVGYFLVHLGVLGVAIAGLLTGLLGWRGNLNIREGETDRTVLLWHGREATPYHLPFAVKNQEFVIEHFASGMPSRFATVLNVNGQTHQLEVNKPLRVGGWLNGYVFYQASFGDGGSSLAGQGLNIRSGTRAPLSAKVYDVARQADGTRIELLDFRPHTLETLPGRVFTDVGPSLDYLVQPPDAGPVQLRAYLNHPDFIGLADGIQAGGFADGEVIYRPVYLGLSVANPAPWPTVAQVLATCPADDFACLGRVAAPYLATITPTAARLEHGLQLAQAVQAVRTFNLTHLLAPQDYTLLRYSGLLVVKDPGAWLFWPSALVLLLGVVAMLGRRLERVFVPLAAVQAPLRPGRQAPRAKK